MKRFEDAAWQESMKIRYDFNNMMAEFIDAEKQDKSFSKKVNPIHPEDIQAMLPKIQRARRSLDSKLGKPSRMMAWSKLPYNQRGVVDGILRSASRIQKKFDNFVVLGIGGSALGPIAVQQALNHLHYNDLPKEKRNGCPRLFVEDNVDPERMSALLDVIDIKKTCFNVISKSGNTSETMSQYLIISALLKEKLGNKWAANVVATTDRKSGNLIRIAKQEGMKTFYIPDGVGGRFSELCPVGLLAAAVCGIDIEELLAGAAYMDALCAKEDLYSNIGWMSGVLNYIAMEQKGKNIQVMMPYADSLKYIADWYAQLWAESLGKKYSLRGKTVHTGQTPVKSLGVTDQHSQVQLYSEGPFDKVITFLGIDHYRSSVTIAPGCEDIPDVAFLGGHTLNELIQKEQIATEFALTKSGKLNQTITLPELNAFTLGQLLYFFMFQTSVAGELLSIDAFDQPGVEEGKKATYALFGKPGYEDKATELAARPEKKPEYIL